MEAAQRIRLIRIIEKTEKNPEFSNKIGIKNTSEQLDDVTGEKNTQCCGSRNRKRIFGEGFIWSLKIK